jgi:hypothetical protein
MDYELWQGEMVWMALYFSAAVAVSLLLNAFPQRPKVWRKHLIS